MSKTSFDPSFAGAAEYAEIYRNLGLQVVPAKHPKEAPQWKRPALPEWRELENTLAPDLTFQRWYGPNGDHANRDNMGIITGRCSNLVVVDLDIQKNQQASLWWQMICEKQQVAQEITTVSQKTGGGGFQHLFKVPEGWTAPTCKTSIGVDIRGQGGFIMCPPSMHESGDRYEWLPNQEPWNIDIAVMPQWLCNEIDKLAEEFGGRSGGPAGQKTATPDHTLTAFGQIQDGREDYMTRFVWGRMVDLYREAPMISKGELEQECQKAFDLYVTQVKSRLPFDGLSSNADLLEKEGRGITTFQQKWQYAAKQWETKVADHARTEPPKKVSNPPFDPLTVRFDPETGEILGENPNPDLSIEDEFAPTPKPEQPNKYKLTPESQLVDEPVQWLVKDLLPVLALGSLYGRPGTYKSFVGKYIAANIALGLPIFGKETVQGDVVYIAGEGGAGIKRRMAALRRRHNMPPIDNLYFLKGQLNFRSSTEDVAGLIKEIVSNKIKPVLIVVDTLARSFGGGNENASEDMGAFIAMIGLLQRTVNSAVLLVHHSGKDEARGQRGHSSLLGAVDAELELMKLSEDDSLHRIGQLTTTKQKDGEDGLKFLFHMETVHLSAIDPENTSLALVPVNDAELPAQKKQKRALNQNDKAVLAALKAAINDAGEVIGLPQIPTGMRVVNVSIWRQFYYSSSPNEQETKKKTFSRAIDRLVSTGTVCSWENYCWFPTD